jgi:hypothetical protein
MDPWLEAPDIFPSVHAGMIFLLQEALNRSLPLGYAATSNNRVWVDPESYRDPDVSIYGREQPPDAGGAATALAGLVAVGQVLLSDPWEEPYLEIRSDRGKRLVTAVEVLSPSNKRASEGRRLYQQKQQECRPGGVHLVEIDLLRAGQPTTTLPRPALERRAGPFDYHVSVRRAGLRDELFGAAIRLADRLPAIGVPLDPGVPAVTVDIQAAFDRCYDGGRYPELVDYAGPPDPPLAPDQQAWADAVLREKGLKP